MNAVARNALSRQAEEILHMDPDKEVGRVEELGLEWVEKDEAASLLEETRKTMLAQLISEHQTAAKATGKSMPMNQAEQLALSDPRYEEHVRAMVKARAEANRAKVRYDSGRIRIELMRSLVAARREEMRLGGFRT